MIIPSLIISVALGAAAVVVGSNVVTINIEQWTGVHIYTHKILFECRKNPTSGGEATCNLGKLLKEPHGLGSRGYPAFSNVQRPF